MTNKFCVISYGKKLIIMFQCQIRRK